MTLEETLKSFKAAFSGKSEELDKANARIASLESEKSELAEKLSELSKSSADASKLAAERDEALLKLDEMTKALEAAERQKVAAVEQIEEVGEKSAKIAASVGVAPVEIAANAGEQKSPEEVWNDYMKISDPAEKLAFYNKNRASIIQHLGIR